MKNILLLLILGAISLTAFGAGTIPLPDKVKTLDGRDGIVFGDALQGGVLYGTLDPTSVAVDATTGAVYQSSSTGLVYVKQDDGSTVNWIPQGDPSVIDHNDLQSLQGGAASEYYHSDLASYTWQNQGLTNLDMNVSGLMTANTVSYEALLTADNDIPNKKYTDTEAARQLKIMTGTAYMEGGLISCTSEGGTNIDVTAMSGWHVDTWTDVMIPDVTDVEYVGGTTIPITNIATTPITWLYINSVGALLQESTPLSSVTYRDKIFIGSVLHPAGTCNAANLANSPVTQGNSLGLMMTDFFSATGPINVSGNVLAPNLGTLGFDKTSGNILLYSLNIKTNPKDPNIRAEASCTQCTFLYTWKDGSGGFNISSPTNVLTPNSYDDGTGGALSPNGSVGVNDWKFDRIYLTPQGIAVQYGQVTYNLRADAVLGYPSEQFDRNPSLEGTLFLGSWLTRQADITLDITNFYPAANAGGGGNSSATYNSWGSVNIAFADSPYSVVGCDKVYNIDASGGVVLIKVPDVPAGVIDCQNQFIMTENTNAVVVSSDSGTVPIGGELTQVISTVNEGFWIMYNAITAEYFKRQDNRGLSAFIVDTDQNVTIPQMLYTKRVIGAGASDDIWGFNFGYDISDGDTTLVGGATKTQSFSTFGLRVGGLVQSGTTAGSVMCWDIPVQPELPVIGAQNGALFKFYMSGTDSNTIEVAAYDGTTKLVNQIPVTLSGTDDAVGEGKVTFAYPATVTTGLRLCAEQLALSTETFTIGTIEWTDDPLVTMSIPSGSEWEDAGITTVSATTTAPTKPTTTVNDKIRWRRVGDSMEVMMVMTWASGSGGANGTGDYLFKIPDGYSIDTTKVTPYAVVEGAGFWTTNNTVGYSTRIWAGSANVTGTVGVYDSQYVRIFENANTTNGVIGSTWASGFNQNNTGYVLNFTVPIVGWSAAGEGIAFAGDLKPNTVALGGNGGEAITGTTENIVFDGTGTGWSDSTYEYTVQHADSIVSLSGMVAQTGTPTLLVLSIYVNGTLHKRVFESRSTYLVGSKEFSYIGVAGEFNKDDLISIRSSLTFTLGGTSVNHYLNIVETPTEVPTTFLVPEKVYSEAESECGYDTISSKKVYCQSVLWTGSTNANFTIATIATDLDVVEITGAIRQTAGVTSGLSYTAAGTSTNSIRGYYDRSSGAIKVDVAVFTVVYARITLRYTK